MKGEKLSILVLLFEIGAIVALHVAKQDKGQIKPEQDIIAKKIKSETAEPLKNDYRHQTSFYFTMLK